MRRHGLTWTISQSTTTSFVMKDVQLPFPNHGHVILATPSPILMYQISTRDTRILIDVPGKLPSASSGALRSYLEKVVCPQLPATVQESFMTALETERLRSMPKPCDKRNVAPPRLPRRARSGRLAACQLLEEPRHELRRIFRV